MSTCRLDVGGQETEDKTTALPDLENRWVEGPGVNIGFLIRQL